MTRKSLTPAHRANIAAAMKGKSKSPEHRQRLSEAGKGKTPWNKGVSPSQEAREKTSKSLTGRPGRPLSEENRTKLAEANVGRPLTAEHRKKLSDATKKWNETPEGLLRREKLLAYYGSIENLEGLKKLHDSWARSPEGIAHARSNHPGLLSTFEKILREKDGDLCQLCLTPIDFKLRKNPLAPSVDHIVPVRAGGSDEARNLWLSHLVCNQTKGARWSGREDGSTDRRRDPL